jgi:hypothetical protein
MGAASSAATSGPLAPFVAPAVLGTVAGMFHSISLLRQHLNPWNR